MSMTDPARFPWTRHPDGSWSAHGYAIKRDSPTAKWRVIRNGEFFDAVEKLPHAKRVCEQDRARLERRGNR